MRRLSLLAVGLASAAVSACGGGSGGGGGGGPSFAGFDPVHEVLASPGGAQDFRAGASVAWLHWNNDGRLDLLVGAPNQSGSGGTIAGVGAAYLYTQDANGTFTLARTFAPSSWSGVTNVAAMSFGAAVATGDLDGDGRADLVIGAPGDAVGATLDAGRVYVVFNDAGQVGTLAGPFAEPAGAQAGAEFGGALAVGRLDGDGRDDVVVSSLGATVATHPAAGRVVGLLGAAPASFGASTTATIASPAPEDDAEFGAQVALGDLNGDGFTDLAVGEPGAAIGSGGAVRLFAGDGAATPAFTVLETLFTNEPGILVDLGASVAVADLDGDGDDDVIAGAPFGDVGASGSGGYVVVYRTGSGSFTNLAPLTDRTPESGAEFGATLAVTDLNGDGRPDLLVGAPAATSGTFFGAGTVSALLGKGNGAFTGPAAADVLHASAPVDDMFFGASLAVGDADGDGTLDLLAVGAPGPTDPFFLQAGLVEVLRTN